MGKSLQTTINHGIDHGYLKLDKSRIGNLEDLNNKDSVVLISDVKERPFANIYKIINGYDKYITIKDTDTIFITESSYPGIEKRSSEILDRIAQIGANGIMLSSKKHLLHHASAEDLMLMINLFNPKYYFPVKGEYQNLYANGEVAEAVGIDKDNIIIKLNGEIAEFVDGKLTDNRETVQIDEVLIDGNSQDDIGNLVLKDREMLSENGIVIISCTLDKDSKEILSGPEILTRGFIYVKESYDLLHQTSELAKEVIEEDVEIGSTRVDYSKIKNDIRDRLGNFFYKETETRPMIITVIQEV